MVAVFAFILTRGSTSSPPADDSLRIGAAANGAAAAPAPSVPTPATDSAPSGSSSKADRKPPATSASVQHAQSSAPVNTGPESPVFKRGQWIAVLDKYPTDVGMEADLLAKGAAAKLVAAGVPAKAMLVDGQYPGIANSSLEPITGTWVLYLGPGTTSQQMENLCSAPKTQRAYKSPACPTYEPAVSAGN